MVAFLREWLPPDAKRAYRELIRTYPDSWFLHPHFASGIVVDHFLRGNGLDESSLDVADLNVVWPELIRLAVDDAPER